MSSNSSVPSQPVTNNKDLVYQNLQQGTSKLQTECNKLAQESYKCLEKNNGDGSKCSDVFAIYKECRKNEHNRKIEDNRARHGVN